jgi:2-desacetyl-2-hydroxyethyl bacteriochlorophyllide A dehydrogenase
VNRKQQGIVFAGVGRAEIRDLRLPELAADEVLVRTLVAGLSVGTDGWYMTGRYSGVGERYPLIYGYQRVGVVEGIGRDVHGLKPGDTVFLGMRSTRLDPRDGLGERGGAYTRYGITAARDAVPLPDGVDLEAAALGGLIAVPMVGRNLTGVAPGDLVVVLGQGLVGQMAAQLCRLRGARVIAADLLERRVELSGRYSADVAVDSSRVELREVVRREAARGADVVFDCTGSSAMFDTCLDLVRGACTNAERPGKICLQGYFPDPIVVDFHKAHQRRLTLTFPCGFDLDGVAEGLRLLQERRLTVTPLITHRWRWDQAPDAFRAMLDRPNDVLAMVLDWRETGGAA